MRDSLMDALLEEELGGDGAPDVAGKVVREWEKRRAAARMWWRMGGMAVAAMVLLGTFLWWQGRDGYAEPRWTNAGSQEWARVERGAVVDAVGGGKLELGGYVNVIVATGSAVRVDGERGRESIFLERGRVECAVVKGKGEFEVASEAGVVHVTGTEFFVEMLDVKGATMGTRKMMVKVLVGSVLVTGAWGQRAMVAGEQATLPMAVEPEPEVKSGTVTGIVGEKGEGWIRIRFEEGKSERYTAHWRGGNPKDGGGFDKDMVKIIKETPVGAKVELQWEWNERKRVVKITVLEKPKEDGETK